MCAELDYLRWNEARGRCSLTFTERFALAAFIVTKAKPAYDLNDLGDLDLIEEAYAHGLRNDLTTYWVEGVLGQSNPQLAKAA